MPAITSDLSPDSLRAHLPSTTPRSGGGARKGALNAILGLNRQFVDLLCTQASTVNHAYPFSNALRSRLARLCAAERLQLASRGVLLIDAGFSDAHRWQALKDATASYRPAATGEERSSCWLPAGEGKLLALSTLLVAWALLQWNRAEGRVLLGMSRDTAAIVQDLSVNDLSMIVAHDSEWLKPRWLKFPRAWMELLEFAQATTAPEHSFATLRCLQWSGVESLTPRLLPRVSRVTI